MNRKFLILLTLACLYIILSSYTFAFSDTKGHWAEKVINDAEEFNIVNGYGNDTFMPDGFMTRAELATTIGRLFIAESESNKYIPDVKRQDWFYSDIRKAISMGIIQGDTEGYIRPNDYVTREEAVLIIARAFNIRPNSNEVINISYADSNDISDWSKPEFLTFIRKHFIVGYTVDNTIRPKDNITRAEILTIIDRVAQYNIPSTLYSTILNTNILIRDTNAQMTNVEIYGDLIIGESASRIIKLNNVSIHGNLVLYAPISDSENLYAVDGEVYKLYENRVNANSYYSNSDYGINFSIPDGASVQNVEDNKLDYNANDLIAVTIKQDEKYYLQSIESISHEEIESQNYDSIFKKIEEGKIGIYPYILYSDNITSNFLFIKRDNVIYELLFLNVVSENIVDSVISNIEFTLGEKIEDHSSVLYENTKLCLKFSYRKGYVGVDDSYNTGNIYSGDSFFKLFIQVNKITDIGDYNISEVKLLLKSLVSKDGTIVNELEKKVAGHDAIQFEIEADDDKLISLYVIIGNNLYNFIFTGDKNRIDILGRDIFQEVVNSMEF